MCSGGLYTLNLGGYFMDTLIKEVEESKTNGMKVIDAIVDQLEINNEYYNLGVGWSDSWSDGPGGDW